MEKNNMQPATLSYILQCKSCGGLGETDQFTDTLICPECHGVMKLSEIRLSGDDSSIDTLLKQLVDSAKRGDAVSKRTLAFLADSPNEHTRTAVGNALYRKKHSGVKSPSEPLNNSDMFTHAQNVVATPLPKSSNRKKITLRPPKEYRRNGCHRIQLYSPDVIGESDYPHIRLKTKNSGSGTVQSYSPDNTNKAKQSQAQEITLGFRVRIFAKSVVWGGVVGLIIVTLAILADGIPLDKNPVLWSILALSPFVFWGAFIGLLLALSAGKIPKSRHIIFAKIGALTGMTIGLFGFGYSIIADGKVSQLASLESFFGCLFGCALFGAFVGFLLSFLGNKGNSLN